jgi:hypothetical protein
MQKIFIKKCFLFTVGSVSRVSGSQLGREFISRTFEVADDARPDRPVEVATEAAGGRVDSI